MLDLLVVVHSLKTLDESRPCSEEQLTLDKQLIARGIVNYRKLFKASLKVQ